MKYIYIHIINLFYLENFYKNLNIIDLKFIIFYKSIYSINL